MKTSIKVEGTDALKAAFDKMAKAQGINMARALAAGGQLVRSTAIKSISEVSAGKTVTRQRANGKTYKHVASKAGDAPNKDTGALTKSIQIENTAEGTYVGTNIEYARDLELGTSTMKARPFLYPALEANKKAIKVLISNATKKGLK